MPTSSDNALLRYRRVLELQSPLPDQVTDLDTWMQRPSMGNVFLQGPDRYIWSQPNLDDMVTLKPPSPEDSFTSKPTQILTHYYHALLGKHIHVRPCTVLIVTLLAYGTDVFSERNLRNT